MGAVDVNNRVYSKLRKNGATIAQEYSAIMGSTSVRTHTVTVTKVVEANGTTDYFDLYAGLTVATDETINAASSATFFTGSRIDGGNGLWTHDAPNIGYTAGNVGIGTTNPYTSLEVVAEDANAYIASTAYRNNSYGGGLTMRHARGTATTPAALQVNDVAGSLWFKGTERMRINSSGNVGIGTAVPGAHKLHVEDIATNQSGAYGIYAKETLGV